MLKMTTAALLGAAAMSGCSAAAVLIATTSSELAIPGLAVALILSFICAIAVWRLAGMRSSQILTRIRGTLTSVTSQNDQLLAEVGEQLRKLSSRLDGLRDELRELAGTGSSARRQVEELLVRTKRLLNVSRSGQLELYERLAELDGVIAKHQKRARIWMRQDLETSALATRQRHFESRVLAAISSSALLHADALDDLAGVVAHDLEALSALDEQLRQLEASRELLLQTLNDQTLRVMDLSRSIEQAEINVQLDQATEQLSALSRPLHSVRTFCESSVSI